MNDCAGTCVAAFIVGAFFSLFLAGTMMRCSNTTPLQIQQQAIDHGVAEYYLDENHDKQFRWKPTPNAAKQQEASE